MRPLPFFPSSADADALGGCSIEEVAAAATLALRGEIATTESHQRAYMERCPFGVVLGMAPWNAPVRPPSFPMFFSLPFLFGKKPEELKLMSTLRGRADYTGAKGSVATYHGWKRRFVVAFFTTFDEDDEKLMKRPGLVCSDPQDE